MFEKRLDALRARLTESGAYVALITDDDSVYYLTGCYDYLHMEFGRPAILVIPADGPGLLITPTMEIDMAEAATRVNRIAPWNDGMGNEWREEIPAVIGQAARIAIEPDRMPPVVHACIKSVAGADRLCSVTPIIEEMRMIESQEELNLAGHAGEVSMAMMDAGRGAIGDGVAEFEVALAISAAGTRKAADLPRNIMPIAACRRTHISCKLWPRARKSPSRITVPARGLCAAASLCSCVSAA